MAVEERIATMADTRMDRIQKLADIVDSSSIKAENKTTALSREIEQEILSLIGNDEPVRKSEVEQKLIDQLFASMSTAYKKAVEEALSSLLRQRRLMLDHHFRLCVLPDNGEKDERR